MKYHPKTVFICEFNFQDVARVRAALEVLIDQVHATGETHHFYNEVEDTEDLLDDFDSIFKHLQDFGS